MLSPEQRRAIQAVEDRSIGPEIDPRWRICLHFHPDRLHHHTPILRAMQIDGVYRNQFQTGTSNGGLTAHPGGDRWIWESRIFAGAYDACDPALRPKYGALNHRQEATGASPRFGSAHFRLASEVLERTTFCYPDSYYHPEHFGTHRRMGLVELVAGGAADPLDAYIEAHVHAEVRIDRDVEALVLDPCYRGTEIERQADSLGCRLEWHGGFAIDVEKLRAHPEYRGPEVVELGCRIAGDGLLTPRVIGDAARSGVHDQQLLKKVWHAVARFGRSHD